MKRNPSSDQPIKTIRTPDQESAKADTRPPEVAALLAQVEELLHEDRPRAAFDLLARSKNGSPWVMNARGVCLLRLGEIESAIQLFRGMVLSTGGILVQPNLPTVFKTNFATALFLSENVSGGLSILKEIKDAHHPSVRKLHAALEHWKQGLSLWQKLQWYLGGQPVHPVVIELPGEL
jgi:hypothetical protein